MMNMCQFSNNTKNYLEQYQCTLKEMIDQMSAARLTDSIGGSFIVQMIPHHRAAIAMSENLLRFTTNIPLQDIAENIIISQQKSIQNMKRAYPKCRVCMNSPKEIDCYEKKNRCITSHMFYEMTTVRPDNNIDVSFMREMIPHHKGAVCMSENALQFPICTELKPLLNSIIGSQKEGIMQMQSLLQQINRCCS